ncbi:MAG: DNA mismatch repair endonuclease MutL [Deltaproteobacteria bacterium]|nr:DNA mismatch repair endonuclease MutL [Deltaproteobacteria bacterium]
MPKIHILPEILANKIAAGEVVERPASIVKELLENAVDARAGHVVVNIEGGGRKRIVVTDDGMGMEPDDMFLALERHATSKLATEADLFDIRSLGFRGEALPSIASVTNLTMESRVRELDVGRRITVQGGVIRTVEEITMQPGARITASRLFHNTPVRLKFLKSSQTEMGHITDMFIRTALPLTEIHFRLDVDGKPNLEFPSGASPKDRLYILWGRQLAQRAVAFSSDTGDPRVSGYLVPPEDSRTAPRHVYAYVNGRWVRDRLLHKAILDAYRPFLTKGRYPMALLFLEVNPARVDVNVHPTKAEVRFTDPQRIYHLVVSNLKTALDAHARSELLPRDVPEIEPWQVGQKRDYHPIRFQEASGGDRNLRGSRSNLHISEPARPAVVPAPRVPETSSPQYRLQESSSLPLVKVLGQLGKSYILCETREGLLIFDQHAAHERVTYEKLKLDAAKTSVSTQMLLTPEVVELSPKEFARIQDLRENLNAVGLEVRPFGERSIIVRQVPALLKQVDVTALINELLDDTAETPPASGDAGPLDPVLIVMACHGSIRSGQALAREEMETLVREVLSLDSPLHCPHGRPIWKKITYTELEKELKRR